MATMQDQHDDFDTYDEGRDMRAETPTLGQVDGQMMDMEGEITPMKARKDTLASERS